MLLQTTSAGQGNKACIYTVLTMIDVFNIVNKLVVCVLSLIVS